VEQVRGEGVDDVAALLAGLDDAGVAEDGEVVRDVDQNDLQAVGQLRDAVRPVAQAADDAQPARVGQGGEEFGAPLGLKRFRHERRGSPGNGRKWGLS
jgi:hypothetical protein